MKFTFNPFAAWFMRPDAHAHLKRQLSEAQVSRVEHAANREYHDAMEKMLQRRIARIEHELREGDR